MIYPRKSLLLDWIFLAGLRRVMRRRFYGVFVRGLEHLESARLLNAPLIACTNHSNWWDGFVVGLLTARLPGRRVYVAQYEKLLKRYRPLRWLGAFGLDLDGSALPGLREAMKLLRDPKNVVWIFPQGVLIPQWNPIVVKSGALWLAQRCGAPLLPVVFRYEWMVESRPSIFVQFGGVLMPGATKVELEAAMQALYDDIGRSLDPEREERLGLSSFAPLFEPKMSMNKRWDWICWQAGGRGPGFNPRNEA
ncbi:MAG: lysophospholipid acyltransferase family protein [Verrucomicrobiota bacterium]